MLSSQGAAMSEHPLAIGIDFGGTSVKIGVVCGSEIIDSAPPISTQDFDGPEALIASMVRAVEDLRLKNPNIVAVGVGMPGFVHFEKGIVFNLTNVRGWQNIPLKDLLQTKLNLPVVADNDANCMAYAEWQLGAGRGFKHLVCASLGTGVGGGVIVNGQMLRGEKSARHRLIFKVAVVITEISVRWKITLETARSRAMRCKPIKQPALKKTSKTARPPRSRKPPSMVMKLRWVVGIASAACSPRR
jgi:predicted NBD/HSP70 family sugar kinase